MSKSTRPHPKNVSGDFYVEDGCCTACGIPEAEAPDHFTFDDANHCYVKKQPCTEAETDRMLEAMYVAELSCIRYRGRDPAIFARLGAMGEPDLCDFPPAGGIPVVLRNHVAFASIDGRPATLEQAVADFRSYWMQERTRNFWGPRHGLFSRMTWFEFSWYESRYHRVYVSHADPDRSRVVMFHSPKATVASHGISSTLNAWLAQSGRFGEQQWYSAQEWAQQIGGSPTPW